MLDDLRALGYRQRYSFWIKKEANRQYSVIDPFTARQFVVKGDIRLHKWEAFEKKADRGKVVDKKLHVGIKGWLDSMVKVCSWLRETYLDKPEVRRKTAPAKQRQVRLPADFDTVLDDAERKILEAKGKRFIIEKTGPDAWTAWLKGDSRQPICVDQSYQFALGEIQLFLDESKIWEPSRRREINVEVRELESGNYLVRALEGAVPLLCSFASNEDLEQTLRFECELLKARGYQIEITTKERLH